MFDGFSNWNLIFNVMLDQKLSFKLIKDEWYGHEYFINNYDKSTNSLIFFMIYWDIENEININMSLKRYIYVNMCMISNGGKVLVVWTNYGISGRQSFIDLWLQHNANFWYF